MEIGRSSSVYSAYSSVRSMPRTRPSELTISVTTRPQPPGRVTRRRNAVSVMPAMGATAKGHASVVGPIFILYFVATVRSGSGCESVRLHVAGVDFDRHGLPDQINREDESRAVGVLAHQ